MSLYTWISGDTLVHGYIQDQCGDVVGGSVVRGVVVVVGRSYA